MKKTYFNRNLLAEIGLYVGNHRGDRAGRLLLQNCKREIKSLNKQLELVCMECAEAETYAEEIALKLGASEEEVYGDSMGVPGIEGLIDLIVKYSQYDPDERIIPPKRKSRFVKLKFVRNKK